MKTIIEKYNVTLMRLTEDKIEMVRKWRNDPKIVQYMNYKEYITPEMQQKWFQRINNNNNYFFIIIYDKKEIGLINIRDIDYEKKEGEGGIFIYDDEYLDSDVPFRAALCLTDFCFEELCLKKIKAHILNNNKRAIEFNTFLGFKIAENQENVKNQLYTLIPDDYYIIRDKIIKLF